MYTAAGVPPAASQAQAAAQAQAVAAVVRKRPAVCSVSAEEEAPATLAALAMPVEEVQENDENKDNAYIYCREQRKT